MKYIQSAIFASLLLLVACAGESDPEGTPELGPAFADGKSDDSSCTSTDFTISDEEITSVTLGADCGTTWFSRSGRFSRDVEFFVDVENPREVPISFVGVCVERLEYMRVHGANLEDPVLAGWEEIAREPIITGTPCGWYEIQPNGSLVSLDDGSDIASILEAGWYSIGVSVPGDFRGGGEFVLGMFAGVVESESTCGDGIVDEGEEFCDGGNDSPFDACGFDCFWNVGYFSGVEGNELPEQAVSLDGFQIVDVENDFQGEDDADWFVYTAPEEGRLAVRDAEGTDTLLTVYHFDNPDVPVDAVNVGECGERCELDVPDAGDYFLEFWREESGASYRVRIEGTNIN